MIGSRKNVVIAASLQFAPNTKKDDYYGEIIIIINNTKKGDLSVKWLKEKLLPN